MPMQPAYRRFARFKLRDRQKEQKEPADARDGGILAARLLTPFHFHLKAFKIGGAIRRFFKRLRLSRIRLPNPTDENARNAVR